MNGTRILEKQKLIRLGKGQKLQASRQKNKESKIKKDVP